MKSIPAFAPWVNRLVLLAATVLFTVIGVRYIADPVHAAAATGTSLHSGFATTTARIGFGAFPLSFALFSLGCLLSSRRLVAGVSLVATVVITVMAVRLFSLTADGPVAESTRLFAPEAVILLLSVSGLLLEAARVKQPRATTPPVHSHVSA
jgi:hypothetical protein